MQYPACNLVIKRLMTHNFEIYNATIFSKIGFHNFFFSYRTYTSRKWPQIGKKKKQTSKDMILEDIEKYSTS